MGLEISKKEAKEKVLESIDNGSAYQKFLELVKYQKGNIDKLKISEDTRIIKAQSSGTIKKINALELGKLSLALGAGKETIDDKIDYKVGIELQKLVGDTVKKGEILAYLYVGDKLPKYDYSKIFEIS